MEKIESGNIKLKDEWKVLRGLEILEYRKIIISFLDDFYHSLKRKKFPTKPHTLKNFRRKYLSLA